jgi:hypothetical protein
MNLTIAFVAVRVAYSHRTSHQGKSTCPWDGKLEGSANQSVQQSSDNSLYVA